MFSEGIRVLSVAWGDFDNDGDVDFASSWRQGVQLYQNNGGVYAAYGSELTGPDGTEMEGIGWFDGGNSLVRGRGHPIKLQRHTILFTYRSTSNG